MDKVVITQEGRSGSVAYHGDGGVISGWWEFAGGDALAVVYLGSASEWQRGHAWALADRDAIFRCVANEVIRQQASGCVADIDAESGWITIKPKSS